MLELVRAGGWPMIPLLFLAVMSLAIIVERFWSLRRKVVLPPGLGGEVRAWVGRGKLDPAHVESLRKTSPLGALLTGDIGEVVEAMLLRRDPDALRGDVVLAAHHGSAGSSTQEFIEATGARHALVSSGAGNRFGHPKPHVVERCAFSIDNGPNRLRHAVA